MAERRKSEESEPRRSASFVASFVASLVDKARDKARDKGQRLAVPPREIWPELLTAKRNGDGMRPVVLG